MIETEKFSPEDLVSVIVPVYNAEKYIRRCVDSVLNQTHENIEVILVDDGSHDISGDICDEYAKLDSRIKVIHQTNAGASAARNTGMREAHGDYIAFVDSDDYIAPRMYEIMLGALRSNEVEICACQLQYEEAISHQNNDLSKVNSRIFGKKTSTEFAEFYYTGCYENGIVCSVCNKLYSAKVLKGLTFFGRSAEDYRFQDQILSKSYNVIVIPELLYVYAMNDSSTTHRPFNEDNLLFLDVLLKRMELFCGNKFILNETNKLFCNIYVEYYYKAQQANIILHDIKLFNKSLKSLAFKGNTNMKFWMRMLLFRISPRLYMKYIS